MLVGGFNQPLWKMMEFVSWDDEIPNFSWKVIKFHGSKPPTSFLCWWNHEYIHLYKFDASWWFLWYLTTALASWLVASIPKTNQSVLNACQFPWKYHGIRKINPGFSMIFHHSSPSFKESPRIVSHVFPASPEPHLADVVKSLHFAPWKWNEVTKSSPRPSHPGEASKIPLPKCWELLYQKSWELLLLKGEKTAWAIAGWSKLTHHIGLEIDSLPVWGRRNTHSNQYLEKGWEKILIKQLDTNRGRIYDGNRFQMSGIDVYPFGRSPKTCEPSSCWWYVVDPSSAKHQLKDGESTSPRISWSSDHHSHMHIIYSVYIYIYIHHTHLYIKVYIEVYIKIYSIYHFITRTLPYII